MNSSNRFVVIMLLALVCLVVEFSSAEITHFHGHKVIRASLNAEQAEVVNDMGLDVWTRDGVSVAAPDNDILVNPTNIEQLTKLGVRYSVLIDDVEEKLQRERDYVASSRKRSLADFHSAYHTFPEIVSYARNITASHPKLATFVPSIGKSIEGADIPAVEITGGKSPKKSIFLSGGQHAREWISPATVVYILDQLLNQYGNDAATTTLVDNFSIYIVPVVNPDGYTYTHTHNRLWRKNRRVNSNGSYGVDLNRNWDEHWCQYGSSKTQSSDTYCGTSAFSEPETKATSAYITKHSHSALIDFHSYGQLVLRPYGWTVSPPPAEALLKSVGDGIASTIKAHGGKVYTSEHGADLYPASGAADDWAFSVAKIPLVYTIELRDTGSYGFQLPPNQIVATGTEAYAALIYLSTRIEI